MYKSPSKVRQASLFWDLEAMLSPKNSLYKLANLIDWDLFEQSFSPLYSKDTGRMAKPIRLMVGLLILKHLRNVSDESVLLCLIERVILWCCGRRELNFHHQFFPQVYMKNAISPF